MNTTFSQPEGTAFSRFMASGRGRAARVAVGGALIATGVLLVPMPLGIAVAAFGLLPIAAGVFNLCPIAPAWGGHFLGHAYCPRRDATNHGEGVQR
jgi:Zn-dependent protease